MPRFSEDTLNQWRMPPSDSEEAKLNNVERLVRDAISADPQLSSLSIDIYGQGSYANDTNVRANSDIDINVRLSRPLFYRLPPGRTMSDFGYSPTTYTFPEYKRAIQSALENKFGLASVKREDKCIKVLQNTNRVTTDVVPTWKYNHHIDDDTTITGAILHCDSGNELMNFSLQHVENGKKKNAVTQKRFKRLTRIVKRIKLKMEEDGHYSNANISSFLIECLLWNCPDRNFNNCASWQERLKNNILFLFTQTNDPIWCQNWSEVSGLLPLFHSGRKWTLNEVNFFLRKMWDYLDLK